jgi:hypothetical protein
MTVGLTALFVALGGTGYAAGTLAHSGTATHPLIWKHLQLQHGWTDFTAGGSATDDPPAFTKDAEGFVHLRGTMDGSGRTTTFAAHLPLGYRPVRKNLWLTVSSTNGDNLPQLVNAGIETSGAIVIWPGNGANLGFVSLDGVEFYAG